MDPGLGFPLQLLAELGTVGAPNAAELMLPNSITKDITRPRTVLRLICFAASPQWWSMRYNCAYQSLPPCILTEGYEDMFARRAGLGGLGVVRCVLDSARIRWIGGLVLCRPVPVTNERIAEFGAVLYQPEVSLIAKVTGELKGSECNRRGCGREPNRAVSSARVLLRAHLVSCPARRAGLNVLVAVLCNTLAVCLAAPGTV